MSADTTPQPDGLILDRSIDTSHLPTVHVVALTTRQVAQILAVSERTVDNLVARKHLPVLRIGRSVRVLSDELLEFMRVGVDKVKATKEQYGD